MNKTEKVLHLFPSSSFSGAENVACQIIKLFENEIEMVYCCPTGPIIKNLEERNVKHIPLEKFNYSSLKKVIDEFKPTIIHTHDIRAGILASLFSNRCKIISHIHGNHEDMRKTNLKTILYLLASPKFKHIFWVSNSCLSNYKFSSKIKHKSSILYNIINPDDVIKKADTDENTYDFDIIYLGRFSYAKNPKRLIDILSLLKEKKPCIKCALVGTGELYDETLNYSSEKGLENNVKFLGFQSNPYKILKSSKVSLMTSVFEGTPMSALEAMALGVPIVSTPTDGLKDVITNDFNGFLSDDNEEFVNHVINILENEELQKKLSQNALKFSREYNDLSKYKDAIRFEYEK